MEGISSMKLKTWNNGNAFAVAHFSLRLIKQASFAGWCGLKIILFKWYILEWNELEDHINAAHERKYCLKCPKCYFSGFWRNTFFEHLTLLHHIFPPLSKSEIGTLSSQQEKDEFLSKFKNTDIRLIASLARIKLNCNICRTDFNNENDLILHKGKPPSFDNFKEILGLVFL